MIPFQHSVASHVKANKYWSKSNIDANGDFIRPETVRKSSKELYKFDCDVCNHTFITQPRYATHNTQPKWCQYCSGSIICDNPSCQMCFERSFASHEKSQYIDPSCTINPRSVFCGANIVFLFICPNPKCKHIFEKNLCDVKHGYFCPYCPNSGKKMLCDDDNCQICFKNSFASQPESEFWSTKNTISPRKVTRASSSVKYWFNCARCENEFQMSPCHISSNKKWCPYCKNKTELKLYDTLKIHYPNLEAQFYANWCRHTTRNTYLPFDFVLEEQKIIIELDGEQHFVQVGKWKSPQDQQKNDLYKMKCANEQKYSVIRISQQDVYEDRIEWLDILKSSIEEIVQSQTVQNHFISLDEDKYKPFMI